jgi:hypothetical protein
MLSRAPSLIVCRCPVLLEGGNETPAEGNLALRFVEGEAPRLFVEGDPAMVGIIDVVLRVFTLCERAIDDFVGVINRAAKRGSAV